MLSHILHVSAGNAQLLEKYLADVPDEQMAQQPPHLPNHPAWTVGHLCVIRSVLCKALGQPVDFPESWMALFARGTTPTADRAAYPAKTELLATFQRLQSTAHEAVRKLAPAQFEAPNPVERLAAFLPTIGDFVVLALVSHDGLHLGQLADWRRAQGLPRVM